MNKYGIVLFSIFAAGLVCAQVPELINYQGRVVDGGGLVNGNQEVRLRLMDAPSGGLEQYNEVQNVMVTDGLYTFSLGASNSLPGSLTSALLTSSVWVEVSIGTNILSPREQIKSVSYALRSGTSMDSEFNSILIASNTQAITQNAGDIQTNALSIQALAVVSSSNSTSISSVDDKVNVVSNTIAGGGASVQAGSTNLQTSGAVDFYVPFSMPFGSPPIVTLTFNQPGGDPYLLGVSTTGFTAHVTLGADSTSIVTTVDANGPPVRSGISEMVDVNGNPGIVYYNDGDEHYEFRRALNSTGTSWGSAVEINPLGGFISGERCQLAMVQGHPAVLTKESAGMVYRRADDANGASWSSTGIVLDATGVTYMDLSVINNEPAVAYPSSSGLTYLRALDAYGSNWASGVAIDTNWGTRKVSLHEVNSKPAVAYYNNGVDGANFSIASNAAGTGWTEPILVISNSGTSVVSLRVANGNPAVASQGGTNDLLFARATDVDGTAWAAPVYVQTEGSVGANSRMAIVGGAPGIVHQGDEGVYYIAAQDPDGAAWGTPVLLDQAPHAGSNSSLAVVGGVPSTLYHVGTLTQLRYCYATAVDGETWVQPIRLDPSEIAQHATMKMVNGHPAMVYADDAGRDLYYTRADDVVGDAWGSPIRINGRLLADQNAELLVADGKPLVCFREQQSNNLQIVIASNANGTAWAEPFEVTTNALSDKSIDLALVNGFPAMVFERSTNLLYMRALDVGGLSWAAPVSVLDAAVDSSTNNVELMEVNGRPAIAYTSDLGAGEKAKYIRALDPDGTLWGTNYYLGFGRDPLMHYVDGLPAVVYYANSSTLRFTRSLDVDGLSWTAPITINSVNYSARDDACGFDVVGGWPMVAYDTSTNGIMAQFATDTFGSNWSPAIFVHTNGLDVGDGLDLLDIGGVPSLGRGGEKAEYIRLFLKDSIVNWIAVGP